MKLQEKHIEFLDSMTEGKWIWEFRLPNMGNGITRATLNAFRDMGILDIKVAQYPEVITDDDVKRGYVKVKLIEKEGMTPGYMYIKKLVSDYRTRDYEVEALKRKVAALQEQINALETKPETNTGKTNSIDTQN